MNLEGLRLSAEACLGVSIWVNVLMGLWAVGL